MKKRKLSVRFKNAMENETFLPMLLVTVCMILALIAKITDSFIYQFSGELLSPMIAQMIILIIPLWLALTVAFPQRSPIYMLSSLGCRKISAEHVFLIIFSSLFMITTSLIINLTVGGVYPISEGFTLLASFTAGAGEYTTTYPYLVIVYAAVPAFVEEVLFRGFIFKGFSRRGEFVSIAVSTAISSFFAFTLAGLPAAIFCGLAYCFIRHITGSLWSCMIVHFVFNLYALFLQTNLAKYFLSAQNTILLIIVVAIVWLASGVFFFTEGAKIFKQRSDKIKEGEAVSSLPDFSFKRLGKNLKEIFTYRPVMICSIISGVCFVAVTVIGIFT